MRDVGQDDATVVVAAADVLAVYVDSVAVFELPALDPRAAQLKAPDMRVTLSQPVVFASPSP